MERNKDLRYVIAANLRFFMQRQECLYQNANALGKAARVAPNTVRNLLDPSKRTVTSEKPEGYPTLDKLDRIAAKLGCQVWELLHPDIQRSIKERSIYRHIETDFNRLQQTNHSIHQDRTTYNPKKTT